MREPNFCAASALLLLLLLLHCRLESLFSQSSMSQQVTEGVANIQFHEEQVELDADGKPKISKSQLKKQANLEKAAKKKAEKAKEREEKESKEQQAKVAASKSVVLEEDKSLPAAKRVCISIIGLVYCSLLCLLSAQLSAALLCCVD